MPSSFARSLFTGALVALLLLGVTSNGHSAKAKKHLLVVTYTTGFRHTEGIAAGEAVLKEMARRYGFFTVDDCRTADDVQKMLTPEGLKPYDGVFFLDTTGDLGIPDLDAFLDWIKAGHAFIGAHSATDTYHDKPAYIAMIGGEFLTHGRQTTNTPIVNDPRFPSVAHWPAGTSLLEEMYHVKNWDRSKVHVLLSLNAVPDDGSATANQPADFPIAWCKRYGKGRVYYCSLGHRADVWQNPVVQRQWLGALRWAFGLAKGSAKPGNPQPQP